MERAAPRRGPPSASSSAWPSSAADSSSPARTRSGRPTRQRKPDLVTVRTGSAPAEAGAEADHERRSWHVQTDNAWSGIVPIGRQLVRAIPLSLLVLAVAIVLNFALPRLAPGDPIDFLIPAEQANKITPEQRMELASQYGLQGSTA